eukprot:TRINITY_DN171_c5_g2_i1.p2 TRINITY_DN171_c5_g2~~TRINITY_DN171_c5_g2_i1.p2  ORF type:complete len:192 (+),score=39.17 TRINITY_DN171_c5_g2_i1:66-578(+)
MSLTLLLGLNIINPGVTEMQRHDVLLSNDKIIALFPASTPSELEETNEDWSTTVLKSLRDECGMQVKVIDKYSGMTMTPGLVDACVPLARAFDGDEERMQLEDKFNQAGITSVGLSMGEAVLSGSVKAVLFDANRLNKTGRVNALVWGMEVGGEGRRWREGKGMMGRERG